jgi:hypothetical protein
MERIGEQEQAVAWEALGSQHRRRASAHRTPADDEPAGIDLLTDLSDDLGDAVFQNRHRIGLLRAFLAVGEVEFDHVEARAAERPRNRDHAAVVLVSAGAVRADESVAACFHRYIFGRACLGW